MRDSNSSAMRTAARRFFSFASIFVLCFFCRPSLSV